MNTAPPSSTPRRMTRIFSGAPNIVIALPGWVSSTNNLLLNSINLVISFTQSLRESLARALSFYRTPSVVVPQSQAAAGDLEKGALGSDFRISYMPVELSYGGDLPCEKSEKRTPRHVVIVPPPGRERRQIQRIANRASWWVRFQLWFNTYR
jgi:hypothetical protein